MNAGEEPFPFFEGVASQGYNVFATLNAVAQEILRRFHHLNEDDQATTETPELQPAVA